MTSWKQQQAEAKKLAARKPADLKDAVRVLTQVLKHYRNQNYSRAVEVTRKVRGALDILAGESALNRK